MTARILFVKHQFKSANNSLGLHTISRTIKFNIFIQHTYYYIYIHSLSVYLYSIHAMNETENIAICFVDLLLKKKSDVAKRKNIYQKRRESETNDALKEKIISGTIECLSIQ